MDMEQYSVPWQKVVAASLAVAVETAVCVITDGARASPRAELLFSGEGTMDVADAMF